MPYALYETLDLGPLKKSKEVFTTADASIVLVAEIAENFMSSTSASEERCLSGSKEIEPDKLLKSAERKEFGDPKIDGFKGKGLRIAPPHLKKKKKKVPLNLERKKEKKKMKQEEDEPEKKMVLQCSSFDKLLEKLKIFKKILHHHKSINANLVKDNSNGSNEATIQQCLT
ncbi:hypothetical protein PIB30_087568 [Stylosanthes scabra]|uniref:Uncharacterized protein n=1 Tax=Stylosanthes scabra TaxID=79078 RepID=A0ABU6WTE1_9FABA|nr:hypothetical protein [Stylosanthes scabra]